MNIDPLGNADVTVKKISMAFMCRKLFQFSRGSGWVL